MEYRRFRRPCYMILTVLYLANGAYIVLKRALIALIERFSETSAAVFAQNSSYMELILFTVCAALFLCCAALLSQGKLRRTFLVLTASRIVAALHFFQNSLPVSLGITLLSALLSITGYLLLAYAHPGADIRAAGWFSAVFSGLYQLSSAFSIFSAIMLNTGIFELWMLFFVRSAQVSTILSIIAAVTQALCFLFLFFCAARSTTVLPPAEPASPAKGPELTTDEDAASKNDEDGDPSSTEHGSQN